MDGVRGCSLLWDLELGNFLLTGIAGRVGRDGGDGAICADMVLMGPA